MNTKHTIKVSALAVTVMVILVVTASVTGTAFADEPPPNPFIAVSITEHWFWVNNFTPETLVTFSIYDHQGDENPILEFSKPTDELGNLTIEGWQHIWDPEPGDYIVATDELIAKDLVLEYITLDVFDPENDLVSGYAMPGREVGVGVGNETGEQWMNVFADEATGEWIAQFEFNVGEDYLTEGSWAGGHVADEEGDVTAAHNSGPPEQPAWFTAFPEQDIVEGWDWPLGAEVHLAIYEDPVASPVYEQDETVVFAPWGSWQLWVWFEFPSEYNLKPGDIVTLTDNVTERTHVVRNLSITAIASEQNTVTGTTDANENITLWSWEDPQGMRLQTTANNIGAWRADFDDVGFDLVPGYHVRAEVWDDGGNDTAVDWYVHPTYTGLWRAVDSHDGSNMQMTISGVGNNQYQLTWTDDYWSICGGRGGIGLGAGSLDLGGSLRVDWVIKCRGAVTWEGQFDYVMDFETGTLWDGANTWYLVGGK